MCIIRRISAIALIAALCFTLFAGCTPSGGTTTPTTLPTAAPTEPTEPPVPTGPTFAEPNGTIHYNKEWDGKTLKVLAIGNSFSVDAMTYLYDIAAAHGVQEVVLGNLYIAGCPLSKHAKIAASGDAAYKYYKNDSGKWNTTANVSLDTALADEDWNIISLQQASSQSGDPSSYDLLDDMITILNNKKALDNAQLVWHMTWAYRSDSTNAAFKKFDSNQLTMYQAIADAVQSEVLGKSEIEIILPSGTVIQNIRKVEGDTLNRDTSHLNEFGQYLAGYVWFVSLTGRPIEELKFIPRILTLSEEDQQLIINVVNQAALYPFQLS